MSRYTTEYRYILENEDWTDERLGLADFPIFDESYRSGLVDKIKSHFMFDEIGSETPARHAQRMRNKLFEIMPYYNQLYESCLVQLNPMLTMDYHVKFDSRLTEILNAIKNSNDNRDGTGTVNVETHDNGSLSKIGNNKGSDERNSTNIENSANNVSENGLDTRHHTESGVDGERDGFNSLVTNNDFTVISDTPEGFIQTNAIGHGTYANSASKDENTSDKSGYDTINRNFNHDNFDYDTSEKNQNGDDIKNSVNDTTGANFGDFSELDVDSKNGTSDTLTHDIISDIVNAIEESIKNAETDSLTHYAGYNGKTMSQMLQEWRDTFLNIDDMILNELEVLFIGVLN